MRIAIKQPKKLILPIVLALSICINLLYLFRIIEFKIGLFPRKTQELEKQNMKPNFIDSPIEYDKGKIKKFINPADSLKTRRK